MVRQIALPENSIGYVLLKQIKVTLLIPTKIVCFNVNETDILSGVLNHNDHGCCTFSKVNCTNVASPLIYLFFLDKLW